MSLTVIPPDLPAYRAGSLGRELPHDQPEPGAVIRRPIEMVNGHDGASQWVTTSARGVCTIAGRKSRGPAPKMDGAGPFRTICRGETAVRDRVSRSTGPGP